MRTGCKIAQATRSRFPLDLGNRLCPRELFSGARTFHGFSRPREPSMFQHRRLRVRQQISCDTKNSMVSRKHGDRVWYDDAENVIPRRLTSSCVFIGINCLLHPFAFSIIESLPRTAQRLPDVRSSGPQCASPDGVSAEGRRCPLRAFRNDAELFADYTLPVRVPRGD